MCINYGHRLQIFSGTVQPDEAQRLLSTRGEDDAALLSEGGPAAGNLVYMAFNEEALQSLVCSLTYVNATDKSTYLYAGDASVPRARHDVYCDGSATVVIDTAKARMTTEATIVLPTEELKKFTQIIWQQDISHLLPPSSGQYS